MNTSGFYKLDADSQSLLVAPNFVHMPGGVSLSRDNEADKSGEHNGWQWFDADSAAYRHFGLVAGTNPMVVTRLQAVLALDARGLLNTVLAAVEQRTRTEQLAWTSATEFHRDSALLNDVLTSVGLSSGDIDALFEFAKTIIV